MKLAIHTTLDYTFDTPTDVLLQLEAAMIPEQDVGFAHIDLSPVEHFARLPGHDTIGDRIWVRVAGRLTVDYRSRVDVRRMSADCATLDAIPPHMLPAETIEYMMPSRYCRSDEFQQLVEADFGRLAGGARVMAIRDWIEEKVAYAPGASTSATGAIETYVERRGVCRDFAHLMIAMVRASAIPARFASVYGMGVEPQDFHAVCEVFLDGAWYMLDPTGMSTSEAMAKIGVGRDAADVSFLTSYGLAQMNTQSVTVREI